MIADKDRFRTELAKLKDVAGLKATNRALNVFIQLLRWARMEGHGSVTISAINHTFGTKLKAETILIAGEESE